MQVWQQIKWLIAKDLRLEWRNRYALNGILLYVLLVVVVIFLAFQQVTPAIWNTLLWVILLFTAVNSIAKSFIGESRQRDLYYYQLAHPQAVILAKIIYNVGLMVVMVTLAVSAYTAVMGFPVVYPMRYFLVLLLGATGFASAFTMVAGIASRAENSASLMAVLSFPIFLPMLILLIGVSDAGFKAYPTVMLWRNYGLLLLINGIITGLSLILFPYLWRD